MASLAVSACAVVFALWVGEAALSAQTAGIVDIRIGQHAGYDRLVLELEHPVTVLRHAIEPGGEVVFELEARPLLPHQTLDTGLSRLGRVEIDATQQGARILIAPRPRLVRAFLLRKPERLVIDCGDPDLRSFDIPPGTRSVRVFEPPLELAESEPAPTETAAEGRSPGAVGPAHEPNQPAAEPAAGPEVTAAEVEPPVEPEVAAAEVEPPVEPEATAAEVEPLVEPEVAAAEVEPPVEPEPVPAEVEPPVEPEPGPAEVQSAPKLPGLEEHSALLSLALAALFAALVAAAGIFALRLWWRMPRGPDPAAELTGGGLAKSAIPADTIMPEEFEIGGDRLGVLEKRIDDEVRARMRLEERVIQLQEELKVIRDRFQRAARAKEGQRPGP